MAIVKFDDYKLADWTDESVSPTYLGYVTTEEAWYIKKHDTAARTVRYAVGLSDYSTNWSNRASLTYYYMFEVF